MLVKTMENYLGLGHPDACTGHTTRDECTDKVYNGFLIALTGVYVFCVLTLVIYVIFCAE